MSTVQVSLDTTANPPVTCNPHKTSVNRGNQTIDWVPAQNQTFNFTSLTFAGSPSCFSTPTVTNSQISVTDDDQAAGDYAYTIVVTQNGVSYSSTASRITGGGGGDPSIKNN